MKPRGRHQEPLAHAFAFRDAVLFPGSLKRGSFSFPGLAQLLCLSQNSFPASHPAASASESLPGGAGGGTSERRGEGQGKRGVGDRWIRGMRKQRKAPLCVFTFPSVCLLQIIGSGRSGSCLVCCFTAVFAGKSSGQRVRRACGQLVYMFFVPLLFQRNHLALVLKEEDGRGQGGGGGGEEAGGGLRCWGHLPLPQAGLETSSCPVNDLSLQDWRGQAQWSHLGSSEVTDHGPVPFRRGGLCGG